MAGGNVDAHIEQAARSGMEIPNTEIPDDLSYLFEMFAILCMTRSSGMVPHPISYVEIKAACDLYGIRLDSWEVSVILQLDAAWMSVFAVVDKK